MADWLVNGLSATQAFGLRLTQDTSWKAGAATRRTTMQLPNMHGLLNLGLPVFDETQVTLDAWLWASSEAQIEEACNQFLAVCSAPRLTLTRISGGLTLTAAAALVTIGHDGWTPGAACHVVVVFAIPGAFLRDPAPATSNDFVFSGTISNQPIVQLAGSTAPIPDPMIRVTGPCTGVTVSDPQTATAISWTGSLPAGQYLFISPHPLSARVSDNAADWSSGGTSVLAGVDYPGAGRLQLWPVVDSGTARSVKFTAQGSGLTPASRLCIQARRSYL